VSVGTASPTLILGRVQNSPMMSSSGRRVGDRSLGRDMPMNNLSIHALDKPVSVLSWSQSGEVPHLLRDLHDRFRLLYLFGSPDFSVIKLFGGVIVEQSDSEEVVSHP
jgi:ABC-type microcin C transport system duplicated ATPase subunit YejF